MGSRATNASAAMSPVIQRLRRGNETECVMISPRGAGGRVAARTRAETSPDAGQNVIGQAEERCHVFAAGTVVDAASMLLTVHEATAVKTGKVDRDIGQ